jgi:hypothetical protein
MNIAILWLTKKYIYFIGGKFVRTEVIRLPNEKEQEVIVISHDKWPLLGQFTLFGTTIIHESAFRTERLLNYVALHEIGHRKQGYGYFIFPLLVICAFAFLAFVSIALWSILDSIIFFKSSYLLTAFLALCLAAFSLGVLGIYSWILELNAEFYAIRKLGLQGVLAAREDIPEHPKFSWYLRAWGLLTHPPNSVTISVYYWTHKN